MACDSGVMLTAKRTTNTLCPPQHGDELQIRIKARCTFQMLQQVYCQRILSSKADTYTSLTFLFRGKRLKPEQVKLLQKPATWLN